MFAYLILLLWACAIIHPKLVLNYQRYSMIVKYDTRLIQVLTQGQTDIVL
jgi:hypothetical protein